jgi:hypothetical protein
MANKIIDTLRIPTFNAAILFISSILPEGIFLQIHPLNFKASDLLLYLTIGYTIIKIFKELSIDKYILKLYHKIVKYGKEKI